MIRNGIKELLKEITGKEAKVEHPADAKHGDYSTNIAIVFELDPEKIIKKIKDNPMFGKVEVVHPGFINFFISKKYLQKELGEILKKGEKFGKLDIGKNKRVQIEFISANPTGPLTVGNARGGPFGDTLANVLEKAGFKIEKAYYINDYGMQILALGHSVLKDSEAKYKGKYIDELRKRIKVKDPYKAGQKAAKIIIDEIVRKTTENMGIKYDEWISERKLHESGQVDEVLEILKKKDLVYQKEGALWFRSSRFGDERDRVLVKKDGWKTYLAGDIALHRYKFEKKKFDKVIDIWGADHYGDVPGLMAGVEALGHKGKLKIILHQFITLFKRGEKQRMSKRKGIYVAMDELLDEVGVDVVRFFFLQKSVNTHLHFDLDLAKVEGEKNPVYYIQYAYARICSILKKSKIKNRTSKKSKVGKENEVLFDNQKSKTQIKNKKILKLLDQPTELNLIKQLIRFPEIIEDTVRDYQVQRLPQYAHELARQFHQFYRDCRVLSEDEDLSQARLNLILATKTVLKNVLDLMGISAPEKM
ncbi:arginine--tRNA ligase [bacterium]|nr:arginine--tRNA ligase [bacterium]